MRGISAVKEARSFVGITDIHTFSIVHVPISLYMPVFQVNRIPNKQNLSLTSGRRGCFVIKFSHNGR